MHSRKRLLLVVIVLVAGLSSSTCSGPPSDSQRAAAGLLWVGDAETGDLGQFQDGLRNDVGGIPPAVVTAPVREGRYSIALTLTGATRADEGICCGSRNELVPRFRDVEEGDDLFFGFSTQLAPGFPTDLGWQVITQFKQNFDGSPPLSLNVEDRQYEIEGGYGHPDGPNEFNQPIGPAVTGVWVDWVLHVRFSADPGIGYVEVWQNGELVLPRFAPGSGTLYPGSGDRAGSYVKTGPYRDPTIPVPATMYLDDWRIGTSYAAVAR